MVIQIMFLMFYVFIHSQFRRLDTDFYNYGRLLDRISLIKSFSAYIMYQGGGTLTEILDISLKMAEKHTENNDMFFSNHGEKIIIDNIEINMFFQTKEVTLMDKLKLLIQLTE